MRKLEFFATLVMCGHWVMAQDHGHLNLGANLPANGGMIFFENGGDFTTDSGYVKTLTFTDTGKYAGYFQGNISLTALHSVNAFGEPQPGGPALGSFIVAEIVSVEGPEGGFFQTWETNSTIAPTHSIPVGTINGSFRFDLSDPILGAGQPGADAYGHIHGRRFTVTKPGLYKVGFRAHDISTNGPGGGPIHTSSDILHVYFQGGVNIVEIRREEAAVRVTAALLAGHTWQLQSSKSLAPSSWVAIGDQLTGNDQLTDFLDNQAGDEERFYRLTGTMVEP